MKREAGILLPITALPSRFGIGCLSAEAYRFADWLVEAGQSYWQILPMGPTGYGDSPYQSFSSYALSPYLISPQVLCEEGLLSVAECVAADGEGQEGQCRYVDYGALYGRRYPLLRAAYERDCRGEERRRFEDGAGAWLEDYALFMAIKGELGGIPLSRWPRPLRLREPDALADCRLRLAREIDFQKWMQYRCFTEWERLKRYANGRGLRIIGDLPIYVSADSADVWVSPHLFCLDGEGIPEAVAGCPPDGFTPRGQLWGNPLYRWERHRAEDFRWWRARMRHALRLCDVVRIDHFRGFDSYFSIPYGAEDATGGHWEQGPGMALIEALREELGGGDVIAEDLGYMTDSVRRLVRESGFAGMKVLQFGFDPEGDFSGEYLPHQYPVHSVAYTGTHDNPTLGEWLAGLGEGEERMLRHYLWEWEAPKEALGERLIALLMRSPSALCLVPLQDYLGLGGEARMNRPATAEGNWRWRLLPEELSAALARRVRDLTRLGGRA